jgi:hypothetical protein
MRARYASVLVVMALTPVLALATTTEFSDWAMAATLVALAAIFIDWLRAYPVAGGR